MSDAAVEAARKYEDEIATIIALLDSAGPEFLDWKGQLHATAEAVHEHMVAHTEGAVKELTARLASATEQLNRDPLRAGEMAELYRRLAAADRLASSKGHDGACRFTACSCGSVEEQKAALSAYWKLRRVGQ